MISDPTFEEEKLAAGIASITMDGSSVAHMYKPGIHLENGTIIKLTFKKYYLSGGCTLDEVQVKKLIKQAQLKTKEVVRLIEEACTPSAER